MMCSRYYFVIKSNGRNMFREFVILLYAGSFVCGSALHPAGRNATSRPAQDHVALPSEASYQKVERPSNKYLPASAPSYYQLNSVDNISEATPAKSVHVHSYGSPNVKQHPASPEHNNYLEKYTPTGEPIRQYFSAPVATKSVTIESHGEVNTQDSVAHTAPHGHNVSPFIVYTNNAVQSRPHYAVPLTAVNTAIESHGAVNIYPSSSYGTQHVAPRLISAVPVSENGDIAQSHVTFTAHSPTVAPYHVDQVQAVTVNPPVAHYVPAPTAPRIAYALNPAIKTVSVPNVPVASKEVTIEAYNSVTAHPPPAAKYAVPVQVPVLYHAVEAHHPAAQQYYIAAPAGGQPIPVTLNPGDARLQYHPVPVHGGHQGGYAKAVLFSPASEVSHVAFNGLGVAYGW